MAEDYGFALAAGTHVLANRLKVLETDPARKAKKQRVVVLKLRLLREVWPQAADTLRRSRDVPRVLSRISADLDARPYVIDLAFGNPFAPYDLRFADNDFIEVLIEVGGLVGLAASDVRSIRKTQRDALRAHKHADWRKLAVRGAAGLALGAAGGWLAAPALAGALGSAAGLAGAAATGHGLALLGGGSLAAGGWGMAGGMWLVAGSGAVVGLAGGGGSELFRQIGAAELRAELIKLQVSYKEGLLHNQMQLAKAKSIIAELVDKKDQLAVQLDGERLMNDRNSARLKEIEAKMTALEDAIRWMRQESE